MTLFLIVFLSLYGGMHVYVFIRLCGTFAPPRTARLILAAGMLLLTVAPLLVRLAEGAGLARTAGWIAWPGYIWMGSIFIFCTTLLASDVVRTVFWAAQRYFGYTTPGILTGATPFKAALLIALLASVYSLYEARAIRTDHVTITTGKLPPDVRRIRIAQISDVHVGLLFPEARLESILQAIRTADPDILVSTGDLVDGRLSRENVISKLDRMAAMFDALPVRGGKFAVTGNHEYYAGLDQALEFTRKAGFTALRNQSAVLPEGITVCGVDDIAWQRMRMPPPAVSEQDLLKAAPVDRFRVLLKHRPTIEPGSDGSFDLQLSGHVHKGQLFPFNLLVRLSYPIASGTSSTANGSTIHVSRGSGTWGPPMRLLAPPEVTVIDIVSSAPVR